MIESLKNSNVALNNCRLNSLKSNNVAFSANIKETPDDSFQKGDIKPIKPKAKDIAKGFFANIAAKIQTHKMEKHFANASVKDFANKVANNDEEGFEESTAQLEKGIEIMQK